MSHQGMKDKEWMQDVLSSQKLITSNYNTFANECATPELRQDMLSLLHEEHDIQAEVFDEMNTRGWYPTTPAEQQKIEQAKQKFMNSFM
ncbi:MAG TPA: spore coat protein [Ruminococcaceae bacterium]|nr:spore coat protein [Oscillospiraceae bacterium]